MSQRYSGGIITANPTAPTTTSASGVWTLEQQFQNSANWPKSSAVAVSRSVRLRASASAYFNRTPASAGNRKTWTWSAWVKRGILSTNQCLFGVNTGSTDATFGTILISNNDQLAVQGFSANWRLTNQVFRDPSAWYHIVVAMDTTQATAANRVQVYVNGVTVTSFLQNNAPTQNTDLAIKNLERLDKLRTDNNLELPISYHLYQVY